MLSLQKFCFGNYILSVSLLSWLAAQVCKTVINYLLCGKLEIERLYGAGGMPSAHSALVCSMFMATAKSQGISSPAFAFAFVLAAIVMYDAILVRRSVGEQGAAIQALIKEQKTNITLPRAAKGHTPLEVVFGAALGVVIGYIVFFATI